MAPEEEQPPSPGATVAAAPTKAAQQHSADDVGASTARMAKEAGSRHQFVNGRPTISAQRTTSGGSVTPWPAERASRQHRTGPARATVRQQRARAPRAPFASPLPYDTSGLRSTDSAYRGEQAKPRTPGVAFVLLCNMPALAILPTGQLNPGTSDHDSAAACLTSSSRRVTPPRNANHEADTPAQCRACHRTAYRTSRRSPVVQFVHDGGWLSPLQLSPLCSRLTVAEPSQRKCKH